MASEVVSPRRARVRVTIYRNGDNSGAKLLTFDPTATTFAQLLELAAQKLESVTPFTRVFVDNGAEADNINDFISGDQLFFSSGEDFKKMAENTTSVASVTVSAGPGAGAGADPKATPSEADSEERRQFLSQIAASVTSAAASLYESSSQYAKANGPSVIRVTLERVEDRVRPIAANMLPHLMRVTSWADEKLDGVYAKLETKSNEFLASPLAARVNENLVMPLKEMVIEPSTAFYNTAVEKFHQLDINRDGKVAVETFVSGLKEQLGSAWNERLVEPAKAFHTAAVKQLQANKTLQNTRELLDKTWNDVVVANFKARVTGPAEAFYQMALNSYMSLKASGNGQVTFQDFQVALRAALGRFWSAHLEGPAQHLYDQFSAVAQNTKDAANSLLGGGPEKTPQ